MLTASRASPASLSRATTSLVSKGVALGVRDTRTPTERAWAINSNKSGRLMGSPPREHKDRNLHGGNLIDQMFALVRAELQRIAIWLCGSAAMHTREVTGLRHFPDGNEWALIRNRSC